MTYPNAFCVKCGTHTATQQKHTVVLQNSARALRGVCPSCESQVYKILPKGKDFNPKAAIEMKAPSMQPEVKARLTIEPRLPEEKRIVLTRRAESAAKAAAPWVYLFAGCMITGIVFGFLVIALS